jgi:hypothetical protein
MKRSKIQQTALADLEEEFQTSLLACLRRCAAGRYGLFGQNDHADPEGRYWSWPEATRLKELSEEIQSIRSEFGQPNETVERYLELCSLKGSNIPGEPKLASAFLAELLAR